jgi:hypothetical protein
MIVLLASDCLKFRSPPRFTKDNGQKVSETGNYVQISLCFTW